MEKAPPVLRIEAPPSTYPFHVLRLAGTAIASYGCLNARAPQALVTALPDLLAASSFVVYFAKRLRKT